MEKDKKIVIKVRAVILHDGQLLTVRHAGNMDYVALPGGHLEYGEDLKQCVSREMIEELGVKPEIGRLLYISTFVEEEKGKQYVEAFFEIKNGIDYVGCEKLARSHAQELDEIVWVSPSDTVCIMPKSFGDDFMAGKLLSDEVRYISVF
ncbi:MAG: NUDIX domain-containing protein [Candidatus Paceibacterota bacterium]|jgi:ADP-ribose pyrophosphatase YjhB (NUDIX family)